MTYESKSRDDYVEVGERIRIFRDRFPDGTLQPFNPNQPFKIIEVAGSFFIQYTAVAYRTPDDERPGIAVAWEPFPGKTPFTAGSELMNAETSAWGRAIVAALAADSKKIASLDEVRARREAQAVNHPSAEERHETPQEAPRATQRAEVGENAQPATEGQEKKLYAMSKALDKLPPAKGSLSFSQASAMIDALKEEQIARAGEETFS
jgi:hypothetical protein